MGGTLPARSSSTNATPGGCTAAAGGDHASRTASMSGRRKDRRPLLVTRHDTMYARGRVNVAEKVAALEALLVQVQRNAAKPRPRRGPRAVTRVAAHEPNIVRPAVVLRDERAVT